MVRGTGALMAALLLAACGTEPAPWTPAQSAALQPADARLASLYDQSCRACHTVADSGAPLAGDRSAWDPRWDKGMPLLLHATIAGMNGMPAGGQCFSCTAQDHEALIRFMAGR